METQTVVFSAVYNRTLTARLYVAGGNAVVQTASTVTEVSTKPGTYLAVFTDVASGEYEIHAYLSDVPTPVAKWYTTLTLTTGVFHAYDGPAKLAAITHAGARVPNVSLVDVTTTNSDMRGTNSALLASSYVAPDNALLSLMAVSQVAIKTVTDKINTALVADGLTWKFTVNALSNAPDGGGGGSATLENQTAILQSLAGIQGTGFASAANSLVQLTSSINTGINSIITQSTPTIGTIVGFPAKLHIGDSYTTATGNAITVYLRDANGNPITAVGSKQFTDPDFTPTLVISQANGVGRVEAIVSYHAPQNAERYLRVQIPSSRSRRGYAGVATMQATLRWSDSRMTLATQAVEWIPQI